MGRRGGHTEMDREVRRHGVAQRGSSSRMGGTVFTCVDKNREGYFGSD